MNAAGVNGVFGASTAGVVITDTRGHIRHLNDAALCLFDVLLDDALGVPCWKIGRLCWPDGAILCGPHCRIQQLAVGGVRASRMPACVSDGNGSQVRVELVSVMLPPLVGGRCAIFHLLAPPAACPVLADDHP